jgi:tetratricopeptide (TPR) repeat protein
MIRRLIAPIFCAVTFLGAFAEEPVAPPVPQTDAKPALPAGDLKAEAERLIRQLESEVWADRETAATAIRALGRAALPHLEAARARMGADACVRLDEIIADLKRTPDAATRDKVGDLLEGYAQLPSAGRQQRIYRLSERLGEDGVPLLLDLLETEQDVAVQQNIIRSLEYLVPGKGALPRLLAFYEKTKAGDGVLAQLRGALLRVLSGIPSAETRAPARAALDADQTFVRIAGIGALIRLGDRESLPRLRKIASGEEKGEDAVRAAALQALVGLLDDQAAPIFRNALEDKNNEIADAAMGGAVAARDQEALPTLWKMVNDELAPVEQRIGRLHVLAGLAAVGNAEGQNESAATVAMREKIVKEAILFTSAWLKKPWGEEKHEALVNILLNVLVLLEAREATDTLEALVRDSALKKADVFRGEIVKTLVLLKGAGAVPLLKEELEKGGADHAFFIAQKLYGLGDPEGARRILQLAETGDEELQSAALRLIGEWRIEPGRARLAAAAQARGETAEAAMEALTQFDPFDDEAFFLSLTKRLKEYLRYPNNLSAVLYLAQCYERRGLPERAVELAAEYRGRKRTAVFESIYSNIFKEAGLYAQADAAFDRLEILSDAGAGYLNNRAWFHCTAFRRPWFDPQRALGMVRRATALEPRSTHYADTLGWALYVAGDHAEAARQLRRALDLMEAGNHPQRAWERTRIARPLFAAGKKKEAVAELERALAEAPADATVRFEAAEFFAAADLRAQAVDALQKSVDFGWVHLKRLDLNPEFDGMRKDPGFILARERMEKARRRLDRRIDALIEELRRTNASTAPKTADDDDAEENPLDEFPFWE